MGWIEVGAVERGAEAEGSGTREDSGEEEERSEETIGEIPWTGVWAACSLNRREGSLSGA